MESSSQITFDVDVATFFSWMHSKRHNFLTTNPLDNEEENLAKIDLVLEAFVLC